MATFNQAKDASGNDVVRCFVKGAAPTVMARAATALANGTSIPWDDALKQRAEQHVQRMEEAGLRVMASPVKDLGPAAFDPDGDLLALVQGLEITSLVGMVDPPREESNVRHSSPGRERGSEHRSASSGHVRPRQAIGYMGRARDDPSCFCLLALAAD